MCRGVASCYDFLCYPDSYNNYSSLMTFAQNSAGSSVEEQSFFVNKMNCALDTWEYMVTNELMFLLRAPAVPRKHWPEYVNLNQAR